jgi:hypothetical protein
MGSTISQLKERKRETPFGGDKAQIVPDNWNAHKKER